MKILLVEDNPKITEIIAMILRGKWFEAKLVSTAYGREGVDLARTETPDIVILDLMLPDIDGFQVLKEIRAFSEVLVVMLTARGEEDDRIRGLQEGADDYIVKPFSPNELVARLKSLVRRKEISTTTAALAGMRTTKDRLIIDTESQRASLGSRPLDMSPREYDLLILFVTNAGTALSKQNLMKSVFPESAEHDTRFVDVYVKKLRESLGENPQNPKLILEDGATGYKFVGEYSMVKNALKDVEG